MDRFGGPAWVTRSPEAPWRLRCLHHRGRVDGSSLAAGTHTAVITVSGNADDSPQTADVEFVVIARPDLVPEDVADHLMGVRTTLSASDLEYLDEIGNDNGSFDVGDFRAWLQKEH